MWYTRLWTIACPWGGHTFVIQEKYKKPQVPADAEEGLGEGEPDEVPEVCPGLVTEVVVKVWAGTAWSQGGSVK